MLKLRIVLIATFFLNSLNAISITTEFFPEERIPSEYYVPNNGDMTLIKLEGWPEDSSITVFEKRLITAKLTQKPSLQCKDEKTSPSIAVFSMGYTPGEPVKFIFKDLKKNLIEEVTIVPSLLYTNSSTDDAKIQATLIQSSPVIYSITFTGFQQDEVLFMKSLSYHECLEDEICCHHTETRLYMPEVLGKKGGIAKVSYKRPNGELLQLEFPWGLEWIKYCTYIDKGKVKSLTEDKQFLKANPGVAKYFKSQRS